MIKLNVILQMSGNEMVVIGIVVIIVLTAIIVGPKLLKARVINSYVKDNEKKMPKNED